MARKGLTAERIVERAIFLIEQNGYEQFSMRDLAGELGVQVSSLYNHVRNIEELYDLVGAEALKRFCRMNPQKAEEEAVEQWIWRISGLYRAFAQENRELYRILTESDGTMAMFLNELFLSGLREDADSEQAVHSWAAVFYSLLHGLVWRELFSGFSEDAALTEQCYRLAVRCYWDGYVTEQKRKAEDK